MEAYENQLKGALLRNSFNFAPKAPTPDPQRQASTQLKTLSPNTAGLANPAHPPRTTSEMEFVKLGATFELPG